MICIFFVRDEVVFCIILATDAQKARLYAPFAYNAA